MAITILSRDIVTTFVTIWRFHISSTDASTVIADPTYLYITTANGVKRASIAVSPFSEIYLGATADPYGAYPTGLWTVTDNGGGDWSIDFIVPSDTTNFTDINDWTTFEVNPPVTVTIDDILSRSPQLIKVPITTSDAVTYKIKVYEGDFLDFDLNPVLIEKTKSKVVTDQTNIYIDVSPFTRSNMRVIPELFYDSNLLIGQSLALLPNESKIVRVDYDIKTLGVTQSSGAVQYFSLDGYRNQFENLSILPNILITGRKRTISRDTHFRLHYKTKDLVSITRVPDTGSPYSLTNVTANDNTNIENVKSFSVDTSGNKCTYIFEYTTGDETVDFSFYDECKYEQYQVIFKNKWGVLETLSLSKKSIEENNINSKKYYGSIIDYNGDFNELNHTEREFNVNGSGLMTLNTELLPEYMNESMKELMLSEQIWFKNTNDIIFPAVKEDQSIRYKTRLNDKAVQYTVKIKLSHNLVNNIK